MNQAMKDEKKIIIKSWSAGMHKNFGSKSRLIKQAAQNVILYESSFYILLQHNRKW